MGYALAMAYAEAEADVLLLDRNLDGAKKAATEITNDKAPMAKRCERMTFFKPSRRNRR